ncbi:ankyrin repeat domain-containing protein [Niallia sp. BSM11]|uniref:ankyrin repeat domain-containing protein n=1 Tax=Niallia sp. BSM11 TaxID=3391576 RepID=UPI00398502B1
MRTLLILFLATIILVGCQAAPEQQKTANQDKENNSEETMMKHKEADSEEPMSNQEKEQFFQAVETGNISEITSFIEKGIDINSVDQEGRTAAMVATYNNDPETVKLLIENGADVNIQDNMKNNPFLYAGAEGYLEIVKLTINAGADPKLVNRFGGTALIPASEHGYVDVIKELLDNTDIDVNHVNNLGWTAMLEAIVLSDGGENQQETIQLLIKHGADVNIPDSNGVTPLQHAKELGFTEIKDILIDAGAKK